MDVKILYILLCFVGASYGHGRLMEPPSRASQWRFGFENPPDYNDNQGFCGGKIHQHQEMEGRCGICGDPYDGPLEHEAPGGKFANGNIVANYLQGSWIDIAIEVTTNHLGFFEFRLCPNNDITQDPEQDCFDQCLLQWTYTAGNDWGICENGTGSLGCGPQETFRACADIGINSDYRKIEVTKLDTE